VSQTPVELYDYGVLRTLDVGTLFVLELTEPLLVLGSRQTPDILDGGRLGSLTLRRRRGGGGLVLLGPGDLWIDWWIPASDARWSPDVRVSALRAGGWWREALRERLGGDVEVYDGPLAGESSHRVVCFAGRGPGEVFVHGRKAVGLAQWRVREGILMTSLLRASPSVAVVDLLTREPEGLREALDHHTYNSLGVGDPHGLVEDLRRLSGPWGCTAPPLMR